MKPFQDDHKELRNHHEVTKSELIVENNDIREKIGKHRWFCDKNVSEQGYKLKY